MQANGNVGRVVVSALLRDYFQVTTGTRGEVKQPAGPSAEVKAIVVDYESHKSLEEAFRGQDAIVEAFNPAVAKYQEAIVQAAITAKVRHIITPDFSTDTFNLNADELQIFEPKRRAQKVLESYAATGAISWTAIIAGPFFDWGRSPLQSMKSLPNIILGINNKAFWINKDSKKVILFGTGSQKVSMSSVDMSGRAVVTILRDPQRFCNRVAYFADYTVSNNELLALVRELDPSGGWEEEHVLVSSFFSQARQLWDQDTKAGVKDRLNTNAYQMLGTYGLFEEEQGNRFGANFATKNEQGFGVSREIFGSMLKKIVIK
jgi:uncharacterized protein YbjT (DUF2867 family)